MHDMPPNSDNAMQVLIQKEILWKFYQHHGPESPLYHEATINTLIRMFGTILSDECRDELAISTDTRVDNRETQDAHCNEDVFIPNPPGRKDPTLSTNDNVSIDYNIVWETLDPNDPDDFVKVRTAEDAHKHCKNTKRHI